MRNKILLVPIFAVLLVVSAIAAYNYSPFSLLSPLFIESNVPDLTDKLSQKISQPITLDYSTAGKVTEVPDSISYLVYNPTTGVVHFSNNQDLSLPPASFTKLITAMVALDLSHLTQLISTTSDSINKEPTILGLKEGEQLTIAELVHAAISTSANDAAATLGSGVANLYGQKHDFFITQMNKKTALLKMNKTHLANPEGYDDDNQYSTLEDLAILIHNVQQNYPEIVDAGRADRKDLLANSTHGFYYLPNWNGLLGLYPGVNGLKIARTEKAGYSTIITANRDKVAVNLILVGAPTLKDRDLYASVLLDEAFAKESLPKVKLTAENLQTRYDTWNELARKIRAELNEQP